MLNGFVGINYKNILDIIHKNIEKRFSEIRIWDFKIWNLKNRQNQKVIR
jgi:hypothetical protein